jgi:hypothetical protein
MSVLCSIGEPGVVGSWLMLREERVEGGREDRAERIRGVVVRSTILLASHLDKVVSWKMLVIVDFLWPRDCVL